MNQFKKHWPSAIHKNRMKTLPTNQKDDLIDSLPEEQIKKKNKELENKSITSATVKNM